MSSVLRHEKKYICSFSTMENLFEVLSAILPKDSHQNGTYHIKSLYFDTANDRFLMENLDGLPKHIKFRLRRYGNEKKNIKFECKTSYFHLKQKRFVHLTLDEAKNISDKVYNPVLSNNSLLNEFYCFHKNEGIKPKIVVDYDRTAFIHKNLNVRITLDRNLTFSQNVNSFWEDNCDGQNIFSEDVGILEVKFNEILPTYITQILKLEDLQQVSFSKYVVSRLACNNRY